ncbi:hypothetical protein [Paracoccus pantotrophus]|uniref:hypothetical protein n=1 Tax=Paracoccus pantotrophus TaxID=82367 RepID=UPI00048EAFEA|nr:hypothetical protein [Paracoccus pantotrophus]
MTTIHMIQAANQALSPADADLNAAVSRRARNLAGDAIEDPIGRLALLEAASILTVALVVDMPDPVASATGVLSEHTRNTLELLDATLAMRADQG